MDKEIMIIGKEPWSKLARHTFAAASAIVPAGKVAPCAAAVNTALWLLWGFALMALYDIQVIERIFARFRRPEKQ